MSSNFLLQILLFWFSQPKGIYTAVWKFYQIFLNFTIDLLLSFV